MEIFYLNSNQKCLIYVILLFVLVKELVTYELQSCESLCRLCISKVTDDGLCQSSLQRLVAQCIDTTHECDSDSNKECSHNYNIVKKFFSLNNGFWCTTEYKSSLHFFPANSLISQCVSLIRSNDFLKLHNRFNCFTSNQKLDFRNTVFSQDFNKSIVFTTKDELKYNEERRTTRSPDRIERWKNEFSSELASFSRVLPVTSCHSALHDLCLRHISCRELWKIFRQSCVVDAQNKCKMTNQNECWQAFEGISWTGLGTCSCFDNNSDCQFIRLQTNYNKCIYEIKSSGNIPVSESPNLLRASSYATTPQLFFDHARQTNSESEMTSNDNTEKNSDQRTQTKKTPTKFMEITFDQEKHFENQRQKSVLEELLTRKEIEIEEQKRGRVEKQSTKESRQKVMEVERQRQEELADANRKHQETLMHYKQEIRQREQYLKEERQRLSQQQQNQQSHTDELPHSPYDRSNNAWTPTEDSSVRREETQLQAPPTTAVMKMDDKYRAFTAPTAYPSHKWHTQKSTVHKWGQRYSTQNILSSTHFTDEAIITATSYRTPIEQSQETQVESSIKKNSSSAVISTSPESKNDAKTETPTEIILSTTQQTTTHLKEKEKIGRLSRPLRPKQLNVGESRDWNTYKSRILITKKSPFFEASSTRNTQIESTCREAYRHCEEESETCRWHLSELQMKCSSDNRRCAREQCAKAVGRFSRYVPRSVVESLMFCQCAFGDGECKHLQQWMYPRCLYSFLRNRPQYNCKETVQFCETDALCSRQLRAFNESCSITLETSRDVKAQRLRRRHFMINNNIENRRREKNFGVTARCATNSQMDACRAAVIGVRGSFLETPCFCEETDTTCRAQQAMVLPNNPCIETAMIDYTKRQALSSTKRKTTSTDDFSFGITEVTVLPALTHHNTDIEDENSPKEKYEMVDVDNSILSHSKPSDGSIIATATSIHKNEIDVMEIDLNEINDTLVATSSEVNETDTHQPAEITLGKISSATTQRTTKKPTVTSAVTEKKTERRPLNHDSLPTGVYVTQRPPPSGGCATRNIDGEWILHYKDSLFRNYDDWSGRCSSWCECSRTEKMTCHDLGCLVDVHCEAVQATVGFGERLYLEGRGACQCQSGKFICDTSEEFSNLEPGLYISLGYSKEELSLIKEKIPKNKLERSGLVSPASSVAKDIATRLQFALERVLPKGTLCRIAVLEHFVQESVIMNQVQYYGVNRYANETIPKWHVGQLEKTCAPYVQKLENIFLLEKADRYQLILSTIKQLRVIDLLDGLPPTTVNPAVGGAAATTGTASRVQSAWWTTFRILFAVLLQSVIRNLLAIP